MTAMSIPPTFVAVTGFFSSRSDTEMTAILFVTFATAYVRGVTSLSKVKASMFCSQWRAPSTTSSPSTSVFSWAGMLGASTSSQTKAWIRKKFV